MIIRQPIQGSEKNESSVDSSRFHRVVEDYFFHISVCDKKITTKFAKKIHPKELN